MNHKIKLLIIFLLSCLDNKIIAQHEALRFEHLDREDGLSSNAITSIIQDRQGYIWIGTTDGLHKYDGYIFTKYQFDPLDSNSLSQNLIYTIWEDKEGFIWTSTFEGLCKFDRKTEKFTRYKPDPASKFSDPNISAINEDKYGVMWVGGASGQLARFDRNTGKFYNESFDLGFRKQSGDNLVHDGINCIYKDRESILWVGNNTGLHRLNIPSAESGQPFKVTITHYYPDPNDAHSLSNNFVRNIFEDHEGILWISTGKGLNSFDKKTNQFKHYLHDPKNNYSISTDLLYSWGSVGAAEDKQGNLWIGTNSGLNKLNKDRTKFTRFRYDRSDIYSLSSDNIGLVFIDRSSILWVGTSALDKANLMQKPFGLLQHNPVNHQSLRDNNITAITGDTSGIIWIGTNGGGLTRWDRINDQFMHFRHDQNNPGSLRYDYVYAILKDREGNLWVCNGDILSLYNKQTGKFFHYNSNALGNKDFDQKNIYSITEDAEGFIWLGTGHGIKRFDKKTGQFKHYYHSKDDPKGISDYTALSIFADSKDYIWIGYGSIATDRLEKKTGYITHFKYDPADTSGISSNIVNSFYEDSKGNLWLATAAGGLCRFDPVKEKFSTYTDKHGLPDNTVFSILEDKQSNLWLATRNGISRFGPLKNTFTNFDDKDGLQGNYFAAGHRDRTTCFRDRDGVLYFGGNNGLTFFDPSAIRASSQIAPVVITNFKLFDKLVKGAAEAKEIKLRHDENYFSFEFASLSYFNAVKNQYAYKLEDVDKDWVYSGTRRYAGYTDIGPGKYIFRVKATNNDGVWNEEGVSVTVIIQPPWWRTWLAYCFYGLLLLAAVIAIHRYQKQKVIKVEREKAQKKELEQAREIERAYHQLKDTQAQLIQQEKMASLGELTAGIAHEIQNPLNFVNNFSDVSNELLEEMKTELAKENTEDALAIAEDVKQNLEKILHHGKRADAIVKGMLQHSRSSSGVKEPTDINALCDEYLRLAYHGLRAKDKNFNAKFETDLDSSIGKINVVPQEIGRVILNLINNAFYAVTERKKLNQEGYEPIVSVSTKKENDSIEVRVKDNGTGIPQKVLDKIFQPFFTTKPTGQGTGLGLSLSYDIVKAHGGEIKVNTKENEGTEFMVVLPA